MYQAPRRSLLHYHRAGLEPLQGRMRLVSFVLLWLSVAPLLVNIYYARRGHVGYGDWVDYYGESAGVLLALLALVLTLGACIHHRIVIRRAIQPQDHAVSIIQTIAFLLAVIALALPFMARTSLAIYMVPALQKRESLFLGSVAQSFEHEINALLLSDLQQYALQHSDAYPDSLAQLYTWTRFERTALTGDGRPAPIPDGQRISQDDVPRLTPVIDDFSRVVYCGAGLRENEPYRARAGRIVLMYTKPGVVWHGITFVWTLDGKLHKCTANEFDAMMRADGVARDESKAAESIHRVRSN